LLHRSGVVAWIISRLILSGGFQSLDPDFDDAHKFNADRRHKIAKQKFKIVNWVWCNESLRQRGDLTVWVSDEALCLWVAQGGNRGAVSQNTRIWRSHCA